MAFRTWPEFSKQIEANVSTHRHTKRDGAISRASRTWWRATRSRNSRPELIADDEKGVILPARSFTRARGRPAGGSRFPPRGLVSIWKPHRTDRFRHALKTPT